MQLLLLLLLLSLLMLCSSVLASNKFDMLDMRGDCDSVPCAVCDDQNLLMQVFALDTVQERLDLAEEFGAVPVHGGDRENALKVIKEGTEGRGVDCALEAVGAQPTIKLAFDLIRMGGM